MWSFWFLTFFKQKINCRFFNATIASNEDQKIAVRNIVNGTSMEAPYIVFGPPGTGKTITIIEAVLQIKNLRKGSQILVCAKANDVCDMLALKLQPYCTKDELIRIHSSNREYVRNGLRWSSLNFIFTASGRKSPNDWLIIAITYLGNIQKSQKSH